jgi:hypothetical protein
MFPINLWWAFRLLQIGPAAAKVFIADTLCNELSLFVSSMHNTLDAAHFPPRGGAASRLTSSSNNHPALFGL